VAIIDAIERAVCAADEAAGDRVELGDELDNNRRSWRATAHGDPPLSSTDSPSDVRPPLVCVHSAVDELTEGHANIAYVYAMGHDRLDRLEEDIGPPVDDDVSEQPDTPPYVARPLLSGLSPNTYTLGAGAGSKATAMCYLLKYMGKNG
jgi:hypothetical protein